MRTGQAVVLTKEISYPPKNEDDSGILEKGTKGTIAGLVQAGDDIMVMFQPEGVAGVYAVSFTSIKRSK